MYFYNIFRFGQKFVDKVANPKDILHFTRKKIIMKKEDKNGKVASVLSQ